MYNVNDTLTINGKEYQVTTVINTVESKTPKVYNDMGWRQQVVVKRVGKQYRKTYGFIVYADGSKSSLGE
jgi:hypothetical protein